jgi:hypothetical protein
MRPPASTDLRAEGGELVKLLGRRVDNQRRLLEFADHSAQ